MNLCLQGSNQQKGAALIISLLLLAVMTLLGVTAMSQSGLETLMAGNLQTSITSLSQAENQLREVEDSLDSSDTIAVPYIAYDELVDPTDLLKTQESGSSGDFIGTVIEYLGPQSLPGESIVIGRETPGTGSEIHLFRNTIMHSNSDNGSQRVIQSIYSVPNEPLAAAGG